MQTDNWKEELVEELVNEHYSTPFSERNGIELRRLLRDMSNRTLEQAAKRRDWTPEEVAAALRQLMEPGK